MLISRGGITGIMFCHQIGGPITGWANISGKLITGILRYCISS